jgi:hypothetical protein
MPDIIRELSLRFKDTFSEFCEIVKTVEFVLGDTPHRVEIVHSFEVDSDYYSARFWIGEGVTFMPDSGEKYWDVASGFILDEGLSKLVIRELTLDAALTKALELFLVVKEGE